jgi:hypothetical protein
MKNPNHFNRPCRILITVLFSLVILSACIQNKGSSSDALTQKTYRGELSEEQFATLSSLKKVDDYPLYTMHYYGAYDQPVSSSDIESQVTSISSEAARRPFARPWACSLFTTLNGSDDMLFGRNFDYYYSPALLLFTKPPAGYASVSMVDLAVVGFGWSFTARSIINRPVIERKALLKTPLVPFDGMNEKGLVIGMAAVPPGHVKPDPKKTTIGQLMVMRKILDTCSSVNEALMIFRAYNIDMQHGLPLQYLIADLSGESVLVEFYDGEMVTIHNDKPWHSATNFLVASVRQSAVGKCKRYDRINQRLTEVKGHLTMQNAMDLLANVSLRRTQWSIVYGMNTGDIKVSMGRNYKNLHRFHLNVRSD